MLFSLLQEEQARQAKQIQVLENERLIFAYFCLLSIGLRRHICDPGVGERKAGAGVATAGERRSDQGDQ